MKGLGGRKKAYDVQWPFSFVPLTLLLPLWCFAFSYSVRLWQRRQLHLEIGDC